MKTAKSLDDSDLSILSELQGDARITNSELAPKVGLSTSACLARTNRLREQGVIKQFATIVDHEKVGFDIVAFTFVDLSPHSQQIASAFSAAIENLANVTESYHLTGVHDYMLKIVARNLPDYRDFIHNSLLTIPGVSKVESMMVLNIEKQQFALPVSGEG